MTAANDANAPTLNAHVGQTLICVPVQILKRSRDQFHEMWEARKWFFLESEELRT